MTDTPLTLKSQRFRAEREGDWRRLESLLANLESGHRKRLSDDDVIALPVLYRATLSSLSVARAISLDRNLVDYLESLCTRAYFYVYGARVTLGERVLQFFVADWPRAVRGLWRETLVSAALLALGTGIAYLLVLRDPVWFNSFVPSGLGGGRGPNASTAELARTLFNNQGPSGLSFFAGFLFTHNAQIALFAFALGFVFCLPSGFLMLYNGLTTGAFVALFVSRGLGVPFGGWILIHGVTELFAVTLAGAAGFRIGWGIAFPGRKARLAAATEAGREAATVMAGVIVMLMVAGLLEGFGRQLITVTPVRYAIAAATALLWGGYFYVWRGKIADDPDLYREKLAQAWIALEKAPERPEKRAQYFWAFRDLDVLIRKNPEEAFRTILLILSLDGSDPVSAQLAAGPLKDLLVNHGPAFHARVEKLSARHPSFKKLLTGVV